MALASRSRDDLSDGILRVLSQRSRLTARTIAEALGVEKAAVNAALYGPLKGKVVQDRGYRWALASSVQADHASNDASSAPRTELGRLCRYYLECVSWDAEDGVSAFASGRFDADYVELSSLPSLESSIDPLGSDAARQLIGRIRRDRTRTLHVGYPVRLRWVQVRKGWQGFLVEPVLLFDFEGEGMSVGPPHLNFAVLKALPRTGSGQLIDEAIELANELGLAKSADELPDTEDLVLRLRQVRSDWDWRETVDPYGLSRGEPLPQIGEQGIYNRAVLIASERSPYTLGLESELDQLGRIDTAKLRGTTLGKWLSQEEVGREAETSTLPLLEPLALNSEQREAVRRALDNPLTVITGPPGTGKSQLVSALLINAAWQGKRVLFSSKNNKAVDVVETRVNALGPRPVLLRVGRAEFQDRLANYLSALLASTSDASDEALYQRQVDIHAELLSQVAQLERELDETIRIRNEVDDLEQAAELGRQTLDHTCFASLRREELLNWSRLVQAFCRAADAASRRAQAPIVRLFWPLLRPPRFSALRKACFAVHQTARQLGLDLPSAPVGDASIVLYVEAGKRLAQAIACAEDALCYRERLAELQSRRRPEAIAAERKRLVDEVSRNSEKLWTLWLRLQPSKLTAEQRVSLSRYVAVLQMINRAHEDNHVVGKEVFREYYRLFPEVAGCLPCWAVTSLSARGKLPFLPGFFDLVVIDEASQCDIASALPLLFRAKRAVIIGDPHQLRHISAVTPREDSILLERHGLVRGRTNWAYASNSLFDLGAGIARAEDVVQLRDHHRSHAAIVEFSNRQFYEGRLRVATPYDRLRRVRSGVGFAPAVRWLHVAGDVRRPASGGAINEVEAGAVVNELRRLLVTGRYQGTVGVVSPFRAQANRIRDLVHSDSELASRAYASEFLAATVHQFQGDERDVMLFSSVVSKGTPDGALTFLGRNPNLFNVAITRARATLVVVGDQAAAERSGIEYLARFAHYVTRADGADHTSQQTATELGPIYPAVPRSERVSDWERVLYGALYAAGLRPIPQYSVDQYAVDFALLNGERKLAIEVDGERYHRAWDGELCRRDQLRNMRLIELGWDVMRFWVYEIRDDMEGCVDRVHTWHTHTKPAAMVPLS